MQYYYYRIEKGKLEEGSGSFIPEGYAPYTLGQEPQELLDARAPSLPDAIAAARARLSTQTNAAILAGFTHTVQGAAYRFGYDAEDQGNFAKANAAALLALVTQNTAFTQPWRGWKDNQPHVLTLTVEEYLTLSRAGGAHQVALQEAHWVRDAKLLEAASLEALRKLEAEYGLVEVQP